ncbi:hypothetical protein [Candidatus Ruminimicrobium bovinum]|uniref:hypothetical protein n=1 Tax=Candidatus Ruminimicrobium bovinum TaxID=3242779 RepID=UPI0039B9A3F6
MYGTNTFSFSKILSGVSKTLNIANQLIPIYQQSKPLISNAKKVFNVIKEFNNTTSNNTIIEPKKNTINSVSNNTNPVFFQ